MGEESLAYSMPCQVKGLVVSSCCSIRRGTALHCTALHCTGGDHVPSRPGVLPGRGIRSAFYPLPVGGSVSSGCHTRFIPVTHEQQDHGILLLDSQPTNISLRRGPRAGSAGLVMDGGEGRGRPPSTVARDSHFQFTSHLSVQARPGQVRSGQARPCCTLR